MLDSSVQLPKTYAATTFRLAICKANVHDQQLAAIGGTYSTPIINTPETANLLVGRSRKLPVVVENDEIAVRLMMPLSLSYDHRLIDGGAAARFLNEIIGYLEAPSRLLLAAVGWVKFASGKN